jgi:tetratricopeptide (TPR) repeat protein
MEEARDELLSLDDKDIGPEPTAWYYDLCNALHALADHEAELKWARELIALPRNPQPVYSRSFEVVALIGLGQLAGIDALFSQFLVPRRDDATAPFTNPIASANRVVAELSWHGHDSTARRLSRVALDRAGATISANDRLSFLAFGREYERAGALADSLLRADTASDAALFWVGALAAARQDSASARTTLSRLERLVRPYDRGETIRARAEILALLGEKDQAVQLLRQAFTEGVPFIGGFHARFGLEPLRGFPAFEAFVKPK